MRVCGCLCGGWLLAPWLILCAAVPLAALAQEECAQCHEEEVAGIEGSLHASWECVACHPGMGETPHPEPLPAAGCGDCHDDAVEELAASVHRSEPGCTSCHGPAHELLPADDPGSLIHPTRLADTCGACHADPERASARGFRPVQPIAAYRGSVHARAVAGGVHGASCSDCHGSHLVLPSSDPRSAVYHRRVPDTCGGCHGEIAEIYAGSVHGQAARHGIRESPVCTDCHGEHRILSPGEAGSPVFATNIPKMTCGRCHSDLRLSEKFGMPSDKVPAYADSYHGLASRAGTVTVAHCASCHGIHDILPSSDPASHIHKDNLAATCGACHPGAGTRFALGPVHVLMAEPEHAVVALVRRVYLWIIFVVVAAMVVHNALDLYRKGGERGPRPPPGAAERVRMSLGFRIAHGLLAGSFIVLAYTGFALKYPEAWWAEPLLQWESSFALRGWLHRTAALVMLAAGVFHLVHLVTSPAARRCLGQFRPRREDWRELKEKVAFLAGRRPHPPAAAWVGYAEKVEYLAVIWGSAVMAITGFALWFENFMLAWLPKWATDLATVIHFYEAVLATLAILVWHFYFVIFDPAVYPMDPAWLSGRSAPGRSAERASAEQPTGEPR